MQQVVIVLIKNDAGEFLSLQRSKGKEDGIVWGFPSGKVEPWETEQDAVAREVLEETGIHCRPVAKIGDRRINEALELSYWRAALSGGSAADPGTGEVTDVAFRSVAELTRLISPAAMHPAVRKELGLDTGKVRRRAFRP